MREHNRTQARQPNKPAAAVPPQQPAVVLNFGNSGHFLGGQALPIGQSAAPPASSPPGSQEGDDDDNTHEYMKWLSTKYTQQAADILYHASTLKEHGWGFSDLRDVSDLEWQTMKIQGGFVKKIKKHLKEWARLPINDKLVRNEDAGPIIFD